MNQQLSHTDALNAITTFEYDAVGNLVKAIDANGNPTSWTYDALNRNAFITFADGLSRQYGYDAIGNMTTHIDRAGNKFTYAYNSIGFLLSKSYPDKTQDTFTYDAIGHMLSAINKDASITFTYDASGRLICETLNGKKTSYAYDIAVGKRTLTYPSGMKVVENFNTRDLITSILQNGEEVVTMNYDDSGRKSSMSYANGITTNYSYNNNGWLSQIASNEDIINLAFTYDVIGNITKSANLIDDAFTETYGYDAISQLTSFKRGSIVDNTYQFDPIGNRLKVFENGVTTNYTSNRINGYSSISGGISFTPQYDANGNLLNDQDHQYIYNLNNKLIGSDTSLTTYAYDALGRRISKITTSGTISFYYVGDQMIEMYYDNKLAVSYLYGNLIDEVLQMKRGNNVYYYHANQLGSSMALTDNNGNVVERVEYEAYGKPTFFNASGSEISESVAGNQILFSGREYDTENKTYYFRARTQHPLIGQFMQKDKSLYDDGMNDYLYVNNRVITCIDLFGYRTYTRTYGDNYFGHTTYTYNEKTLLETLGDWLDDMFTPRPKPYKSRCEEYAEEYKRKCEDIAGCENNNCKLWYESARDNCRRGNKKEFEDDFKKASQRREQNIRSNNYRNNYRNNYNNNNHTKPDLRGLSQEERYKRIQQENYLRNGGTDLDGYKRTQGMTQQQRLDYYRQHSY